MNIFLSYANADREIAHRIQTDLARRGIGVFAAPESILPGQSIAQVITSAIKAADAVLFLLSSASASSTWLNTEIALAVSEVSSGKAKRLVPIILEKHVALPIYLQDFLALDLSDDREYHKNIELLERALSEPATAEEFQQGMKSKRRLITEGRTTLELDKLEYLIAQSHRMERVTWLVTLALGVFAVGSTIIVYYFTQSVEKGEIFAVVTALAGVMVGVLSAGFVSVERRRRYKQEEEHVLYRIRALRNEFAHGKGGQVE